MQLLAFFDPLPGTQYDVIVTKNWPSLRTHLANLPSSLVAYVLNGWSLTEQVSRNIGGGADAPLPPPRLLRGPWEWR